MDNCLAIIAARGGSKRIPRKNIKDFLGYPIIKYSIDAALQAACFDEVMVSTDDEEIAEVARSFGAVIPFMRSKEAASDHATTADVILEVVNEYKRRGKEYRFCCCLYATAPFVTANDLSNCFDKIINSNAESLIPVVRFAYPILRSFKIDNGLLKMNWPEYIVTRSQDLPAAYHDSGQFYFLRVDSFLRDKKIFADVAIPVEMNELLVQDIDNEEDWKLAELKYKMLNS